MDWIHPATIVTNMNNDDKPLPAPTKEGRGCKRHRGRD